MTNIEGTSSADKKERKGKQQHIAYIIEGAPKVNILSKGTMKRKIAELMVVHKKERITSTKAPDRSMLKFWDVEEIWGGGE